ncbi:MAG: hypothetical protein ABIT01_07900 [Thermoanaerobaculia bacterium]
MTTTTRDPWLLSRATDLWLFGGSTVAALLLLVVGSFTGDLRGPAPPWLFLLAVVGVDVGHVWATGWRVYASRSDPSERTFLYATIPVAAYAVLVLAHAISPALFWRLLAYTAVFHFVRQQYGWVALYRKKNGEGEEADGSAARRIDTGTIYAATLAPLVYWHAHQPRAFSWFIAGDFVTGLPESAGTIAIALFGISLVIYVAKEMLRARRGLPISWGKNLVMATTIVTWFLGIVVLNSDYAFTVMNVLVHGIPYFGLVLVTGRRSAAARVRSGETAAPGDRALASVLLFLLPLLLLAFLEEWGWDRAVWHEHARLFPGPRFTPGSLALTFLVPLLALPQATHYLLDGFLWRIHRRDGNEAVERTLPIERGPERGIPRMSAG